MNDEWDETVVTEGEDESEAVTIRRHPSVHLPPDVTFTHKVGEPVLLHKGVRILPAAHLSDGVVLGEDSLVGHGAIISEGVRVGKRTKIWHYANILRSVTIGDDCMIGAWVQIDPGVRIGNRVRVQPQCIISTSDIEDDVFIGAATTITNALYPPSKRFARSKIGKKAVILSNVIMLPGVNVGDDAVVGSGSVVTKDVPPGIVVFGNPARPRYTRQEYETKREKWEKGE